MSTESGAVSVIAPDTESRAHSAVSDPVYVLRPVTASRMVYAPPRRGGCERPNDAQALATATMAKRRTRIRAPEGRFGKIRIRFVFWQVSLVRLVPGVEIAASMPRRRSSSSSSSSPKSSKRSAPAIPELITPAQQQRSRETHNAILAAFRELLSAKPFDQIAVVEIAERAGVSVGGVYARFAGKHALLVPLFEDILGVCTAALDRAMDDATQPGKTLEDVVLAYVTAMVTMFRRFRTPMIQVARAATGDAARAIGEGAHAFNMHAHERFRVAARAHRADISHPSPQAAIELALFFGSASAREGILSENWRSYEVKPDDVTLTREIAAAMLAFLRSG